MDRILAVHNSHNASICEINNNKIVYFQEAERLIKKKKSSYWPILFNKYKNQKFNKIIFVDANQQKIKDKTDIINFLKQCNIKYDKFYLKRNHHFYHASSAFFNSGYKKSFVLVIDGAGMKTDKRDMEIVSCYYFYKNKYKKIFKVFSSKDERIENNNYYINTISLGHIFEYVREILNVKEEGAVMALSSYTDQVYSNNFFIKKFNHFTTVSSMMLSAVCHPKEKFTLSNTIQAELEDIVLEYIKNIVKNKKRNLCVSGGVFQNTILNSKILDVCQNLYVDPFSDDSGISMGAALFEMNKTKFVKQRIKNLYLGDSFSYKDVPINKGYFVKYADVADIISQKKNIVAIVQGRNETGRRALGNRSFLFDPRDNYAKEKINILKGREWFRPTAGTVLYEKRNEWFDLKSKDESEFMSYVFKVKNKKIPGVTHVDNTCRIQTLKKEQNFHFYNLINEFYKITGIPVLLNTSFNLSGKPLVNDMNDVKENISDLIYFPEIGKIYDKKDIYDTYIF